MPPPPRPRGPPQKLSQKLLALYALGVPIGLVVVSAALVGLVVVWDAEQALPISHTEFARLWRRAVQHNPFVQAFSLNFGAIGLGYSIVKLLEHRAALKAEQQQQAGQAQRGRRAAKAADSRKDQ